MECHAATKGPVSAFPVAAHADNDQVGIIKCRSKCMDKRVAEFTSFMNRTRRLRRSMAWYVVRELLEHDLRVARCLGRQGGTADIARARALMMQFR